MNKITIGKATMMHLDCMEYMATLPDKYFELAIVDPPYGINAPSMSMGQNLNRADGWKHDKSTAVKIKKGRLNSGGGKLKNRLLNNSNIKWDDAPPTQEYFNELMRVSKNQVIWGGNYFNLPPARGIGCWDKCQPWENFSQFELMWTSFDCPAFMFRHSNTGGANKETKIHPTQKPIAIYEYLLNKLAKPDFKILDTHGGSFSSAIACNNLGFEFHGCELDADYFNEAVLRVTKAYCQAPLFEPAAVVKPLQEALL